MMTAFLDISNISKRFGGVTALSGVDMTLEAGKVHCLVGENGSGKSTLIKIISGVQPPEPGGRILIEGREVSRLTPQESTRAGIQVIYQDLSLFPNLTVAENIAINGHFGPPHLVRWGALRKSAQEALGKIGVSLDLDAIVGSLTIANRQLVAICRALTADARLLIMDEPTASLTRTEVNSLLKLVRALKAKGICIVFVSHRLDEVLEVADRVTVLRDGKKVGTYPATEMNDKKLAVLMTGKQFSYDLKQTDVSDSPVVLAVDGLTRQGEFEDIAFELRAGEILGVTGLLGSGRTELALTLFGMTRPERGNIRLGGKPLLLRSNQDAIEAGIAYVSEDRLTMGLALDQPISSNMVVTVLQQLAGWLNLVPTASRQAMVDRWVKDLAIKVSDTGNAVRTLSGGNQQRVVLAKWLARKPRVLILDSPTVGVDISAKDGIYEIVKHLAAQGVAILLISDEIPEVLYHSHRILVMREGRLASEHRPHETDEHQLMAAVNA
jgi:simple sugar transport system ATP-binding protein